MIGLLFLAGIGLWLTAAIMLSKRIPRWVGITKHTKAASVLVFPLVLTAPIADDLIGRWQFYRLCDRQAVVTLSPDWERVKKVRANHLNRAEIGNSVIPVYSHVSQYVDVETDRVFLSANTLTTYGGFFQRHLYGLGSSSECRPKNLGQIFKQVNLDKLIEQGKTK